MFLQFIIFLTFANVWYVFVLLLKLFNKLYFQCFPTRRSDFEGLFLNFVTFLPCPTPRWTRCHVRVWAKRCSKGEEGGVWICPNLCHAAYEQPLRASKLLSFSWQGITEIYPFNTIECKLIHIVLCNTMFQLTMGPVLSNLQM